MTHYIVSYRTFFYRYTSCYIILYYIKLYHIIWYDMMYDIVWLFAILLCTVITHTSLLHPAYQSNICPIFIFSPILSHPLSYPLSSPPFLSLPYPNLSLSLSYPIPLASYPILSHPLHLFLYPILSPPLLSSPIILPVTCATPRYYLMQGGRVFCGG